MHAVARLMSYTQAPGVERRHARSLQAQNAQVHPYAVGSRKVFGSCKRSYGMRRMRWLGFATSGLQVKLTAIAYNLRRSWRLLAATPA